jgi:hypothetical protein
MKFVDTLSTSAKRAFIAAAHISPVGNPDLVGAWERGVKHLATTKGISPDQFISIVWDRATIDSASQVLEPADRNRLAAALAPIDQSFISATEPDTDGQLTQYEPAAGSSWYWRRVPKQAVREGLW